MGILRLSDMESIADLLQEPLLQILIYLTLW